MKKVINTLTLLLILHAAPCLAQDSSIADAAAGACINGSQWFRLYDIYEKDSASMSPMIRRFSKAMLATAFNRNEEAAEAITTLVRNHQQEIGAGNAVSMLSLLSTTYSRLGDNTKASATMKNLADQLEGSADTATVAELRRKQHLYDTLGKSALYQRDNGGNTSHTVPFSTVPFSADSTQVLIHIGSRLNGQKCTMTFDTGATYNVITPKLAAKYHLTPTDATISVIGTKLGTGRIAIAKELTIGTLTLRNVPFVILDLDSGNERVRHTADAYSCILGESLLMQFPHYIIDFEKSTVTLSSDTLTTSRQRPNICLTPSGRTPYAEIEYGGGTFAITLDTGAVATTLGNAFYRDYTADVAREGKWDIAASTGFGGVTYDSIFRLPSLTMRLSATPFTLRNVPVSALSTSNALSANYGRLGLDFFRLWKKVTINNAAMTIEVE